MPSRLRQRQARPIRGLGVLACAADMDNLLAHLEGAKAVLLSLEGKPGYGKAVDLQAGAARRLLASTTQIQGAEAAAVIKEISEIFPEAARDPLLELVSQKLSGGEAPRGGGASSRVKQQDYSACHAYCTAEVRSCATPLIYIYIS